MRRWDRLLEVIDIAPILQSLSSYRFMQKEKTMLRLALLFLIIALIAGALGIYPVAGIASEIGWILFVIFLVLFVVSLIFGGMRSGPPV